MVSVKASLERGNRAFNSYDLWGCLVCLGFSGARSDMGWGPNSTLPFSQAFLPGSAVTFKCLEKTWRCCRAFAVYFMFMLGEFRDPLCGVSIARCNMMSMIVSSDLYGSHLPRVLNADPLAFLVSGEEDGLVCDEQSWCGDWGNLGTSIVSML